MVGGLHHRLHPLPPGRPAPLTAHLRAPSNGASRTRPRVKVAAKIQVLLAIIFAIVALIFRQPLEDGLLAGNDALYWVFFSSVLFYAAQLLRPRLPRRPPAIRPLHRPDPVRVGLPDPVRGARRGRPAEPAQTMVAIGIVAAPLLSLHGRSFPRSAGGQSGKPSSERMRVSPTRRKPSRWRNSPCPAAPVSSAHSS